MPCEHSVVILDTLMHIEISKYEDSVTFTDLDHLDDIIRGSLRVNVQLNDDDWARFKAPVYTGSTISASSGMFYKEILLRALGDIKGIYEQLGGNTRYLLSTADWFYKHGTAQDNSFWSICEQMYAMEVSPYFFTGQGQSDTTPSLVAVVKKMSATSDIQAAVLKLGLVTANEVKSLYLVFCHKKAC